MYEAEVTIEGATKYQQSKEYVSGMPRKTKETHKDYEERTWRERAWVNKDGYMYMPGIAFKKALVSAAQYNGTQIPGQGKKTYTKKFSAGVYTNDNIVLPVKKQDIVGEWVFGSSNGKPGQGGRVWKCFPTVENWGGTIQLVILDDIITPDVLLEHLTIAGQFIGVGMWRPENGGEHGRFRVEDIRHNFEQG